MLKVVELFAGIGSQTQALKNLEVKSHQKEQKKKKKGC